MRIDRLQIRMPAKMWLLAGLLSGVLAGCQSVQIDSAFGPASAAGFGASFAWLPDEPAVDHPLLNDPSMNKFIRETIEEQLKAKGYKCSSPPDGFWITHQLTWRLDTHDPDANPDADVIVSLVVIALNPDTRNPMWRGAASSTISPSLTPSKRAEKIKKAVHRMLAEIPEH